MSETQSEGALTGKMFLFDRPELLSKEAHGDLGISAPEKRYEFCSKVRAIPVTVSEIPAAMKDYPIVFMTKENPVPLAIVGMNEDVNLFIDDNGNWEENRYIPGYVRRYPFGLASESDGKRMAIIIDTGFVGMKTGGDVPLFENGEPTTSTEQAIEFCKAFERDRLMSEEFGKRLEPYDIIQGQTAQYTPPGASDPQSFAQYFGIDEERLNQLTDEQYLELRKTGMLAILYAVMMSMGNWRILLQRRVKRYGLSEEQIAGQQPIIN